MFKKMWMVALLVAWGGSGMLAAQAQEPGVVVVQQTEIKRISGEVVNVRSNLLTLRHDDGTGRESYRIPRGASITIGGQQIRLQDLQPGQKIRVYYRETETGRVIVMSPPEETETLIIVEEPEVDVVEPAPEPMPAALPTTASPLPLLGGLGALFVAAGGLLAGWRRRRG
jgi:hypothetical protein